MWLWNIRIKLLWAFLDFEDAYLLRLGETMKF